jgi:hypothetical protein
MSNVTYPNYTLPVNNDTASVLFYLTRALKAAGWIYRASGNGTSKDTTGAYGSDLWISAGGQGTGGSGATASITVSSDVGTVSNLSGFTSDTAGQRWLTISGAGNSSNNGTFKILDYISASSVTVRIPGGTAGSDPNNNSISWTEKIPLLDTKSTSVTSSAWICLQGPSTIKIPITTLATDSVAIINRFGGTQTSSSASIYNVNNGIATVNGLSNMTMASVGRILTISGAATSANNGNWIISNWNSSTSVNICNVNAVQGDANNGSITWKECNQTPQFIRGEDITQTTTGAKAELLGVNIDYTNGQGYLVAMPRIVGSGGGRMGWNSTSSLTGSISGATITPSGTVIEYVREVVFWLGSNGVFNGYIQCVDAVSEDVSGSYRFSSLAVSTATASVAPGGSVSSFPAYGSYVFCGKAEDTPNNAGTGAFGLCGLNSGSYYLSGKAQIMCADATFRDGYSADGSFLCAIPTSAPASTGYIGFVYTRLDNQEEGDVDPYVMYSPSNNTVSQTYGFQAGDTYRKGSITAFTLYNTAYDAFNLVTGPSSCSSPDKITFRGYLRRGFRDTMDRYQTFVPGVLCYFGYYSSNQYSGSNYARGTMQAVLLHNTSSGITYMDKVATMVSTTTYVMEPVWVLCYPVYGYSVSSYGIDTPRVLKGTCRWLRAIGIPSLGTAVMDTYGNKSWVQMSQLGASSVVLLAGPWDGTTTPART